MRRLGCSTSILNFSFSILPARLVRRDHILQRALQEEVLLRDVVDFAVQHAREALDGFGDWHVLACAPGEMLRDGERLREETFDLARPLHGQLILIRQLFHPQNGDDVLKILVALEDTLYAERNPIMLIAHDIRVEDAAG